MVTEVLYNPLADNGNGLENTKRFCSSLGECNYTDIRGVTDLASYIAALDPDVRFVIAGGDGTLNKFVNMLGDFDPMAEDAKEIYYAPVGSGNDFAHDIGSSGESGLVKINKYLSGLPTVSVNGKTSRFLNGVGYGIDGYCCEIGDELRAQSKKKINYAAIAIKGLLFHFKPRYATVTVDGVTKEYKKVWLAPTMNGRYYGGGMNVAPDQKRTDGDGSVSVVVMHGSGKLKTLAVFPSIFKGEHIAHKEMVDVITGHEVTVKFDMPTALQIDGETVCGVTEYSVSGRISSSSKKAEEEYATA